MDGSRTARLIETVLRCYPARWRRRHGEEAAELAALLIRDGTPAASIAFSYLTGAAREWLTPRLSRVACALLVAVCSLGVSAGLLASAAPARAASTRAGPAIARAYRAGSTRAGSTSRPSACPHGRPGAIQDVLPAMGRPSVIIWEAGHGRSC
jgi:hypothetical protein